MYEDIRKKEKSMTVSTSRTSFQSGRANRHNSKMITLGRACVQREPVPVDEDFDGVGDEFKDNVHTEIKFKKIADHAYLYDESMILIWNQADGTYLNSKKEVVDLAGLVASASHTVIVGMGEVGKITKPTDKIMTSDASPCLILIIKNEHFISMAHIYVGNRKDDIDSIIENLKPTDHVILATEVNPLEESIISHKEQNWEEYNMQRERRIKLDRVLTEKKSESKIASYTYIGDMANASMTFAGGVTKHESGSEPDDIARMAYERSKRTDNRYKAKIPVPLRSRFSNVEEGDEYDLDELIQKVSVYKGPTREKGSDGFDEDEMYAVFSRSPAARRLEEEVGAAGFTYAGDTGSQSNANTDIEEKEIRINKTRDVLRAALGFVYELMNAKNERRHREVFEMFHQEKTKANAEAFAYEMLRIEAEAVFMRTLVAIETETTEVLANKNYIEIVRGEGSDSEKINQIYEVMIESGTIGQGKIPAVQYYVDMFMKYNNYSS